jgi:hypothetical protein
VIDAWREASGYAAAGVQTGAGIVAGVVLAVAAGGSLFGIPARTWRFR